MSFESSTIRLVRYHPRSFNDPDNDRLIERCALVDLLYLNSDKGHCISEQIRDQDYIHTYFDFDVLGHEGTDITSTINHSEKLIVELLHRPYALDVAWSFVHKTTVKGPKLSLHAIVTNVLMKIDDLYDLIHDNNEILELEHIDCSVYPCYGKMQKFCVQIHVHIQGSESNLNFEKNFVLGTKYACIESLSTPQLPK